MRYIKAVTHYYVRLHRYIRRRLPLDVAYNCRLIVQQVRAYNSLQCTTTAV